MKNDLLLLITAAIWGFAFVAQRAGMRLIGPLTYNGVRFTLGLVSLLPVLFLSLRGRTKNEPAQAPPNRRALLVWGIIAGLLLCAACAFQQMGVVFTTAGKAGFITCLYVVLVPVFGIFLGTKSSAAGWAGALLAISGLYLLSIQESFSINKGDLLVLLSSLFFAGHTLLVAKTSARFDPIVFSFIQYAVCAAASSMAALFGELWNTEAVLSAWLPIVYGGVFSVGIAYSLQIAALRKAHPTHASIILSLAGLFAAAGGFLILGERFSVREISGGLLMLGGAIISRVKK
ncbi:MAG: DMT family transporter [Spirochaetales bacterium]|nr:DMT family transporter [Spirochaetales bacterium]